MRVLSCVLEAPHDACPSPVGIGHKFDLVSDQDADAMQTHLSGEVGEHKLSVRHADTEQRIRQHFFYCACGYVRFAILHVKLEYNNKEALVRQTLLAGCRGGDGDI